MKMKVTEISEAQMENLRKYTAILMSEGMGDITGEIVPSIARLVSVADEHNGWDSSGIANIEYMCDGYITQKKLRVSIIISRVLDFKSKYINPVPRDLEAEYLQFLKDLELEVIRCENKLLEIETPELSDTFKYKNKTFIGKIRANNKRTIKYIKKLTKNK